MPVKSAVLFGEAAIVREPICLPANTRIHAAIEQLGRSNSGGTASTESPSISDRSLGYDERQQQLHRDQRSRCIIVTDGARVLGIATITQLLTATLDLGTNDPANPHTLEAVCTVVPLYEREGVATLTDLQRIFQERRHDCDGLAIVTERGRPIGLLSTASLLYGIQVAETAQLSGALDRTIVPGAEAWQASESRYQALFENNRDAIAIADVRGHLIEANRAATLLFGYTRTELLDRVHTELYPIQHRSQIADRFENILQSGDGCDIATNQHVTCRNGRVKYVDVCAQLIEIENTKLVQLAFHDVTQRNWQENALQSVLQATSLTFGRDFCVALVIALSTAIDVDCVFLMEARADGTIEALAGWVDGVLKSAMPCVTTEQTPCEQVLKNGSLICERNLHEVFPESPAVKEFGAQSYIGVAFYDEHGKARGHLCALSRRPMEHAQQILSVLNIFAARAVTELERQHTHEIIQQVNRDLTAAVFERTAELHERDLFFQTIIDLESFPFAMFWKDRNLVYVGCNRQFADHAGLHSVSDIVGKTDEEMPWKPEETESFQADDRQVILSNRAQLGIIESQVCANGEQIWLETSRIPLHDAAGNVTGVLGIYQDITARRQAEADRQQLVDRLDLAVKSAELGIWDWDIANDRLVWDARMYAMYGIEHSEDNAARTYEYWESCLHPDDRDAAFNYTSSLLGTPGRDFDLTFRIVRPDGNTRIIDSHGVVQRDDAGQPTRIIGVNCDVTERKLAEQQLRASKEAAELADLAKSNFLALMSHELRTPLNGILGLASLLFQTALDDRQTEYLKSLHGSAASLSQIVSDILDFSKMQADDLQLETKEFTLQEVVARLEALLANEARDKQLELNFEIGDDIPSLLAGDPLRLGQVLFNLVSNAIKFTDRGSVTIAIVECQRSNTETDLKFSVRDTGIGLSEQAIESLFDSFTQADPSTSRRHGGTGLGLAICQRLIELMGGEITVRSTVGSGSIFEFELTFAYYRASSSKVESASSTDREARSQPMTSRSPSQSLSRPPEATPERLDAELARSPRQPSHQPYHQPQRSTGDRSPRQDAPRHNTHILCGASVLVVEDNEINQLIAQQVLQQAGMQVTIAPNGRKAIAEAINFRFDLILMDVRMPELDGLEATRRLRRLAQLGTASTQYLATVPIVAMTAHAFESDRTRSLDVGMDEHLTKPIDASLLLRTLADLLERNRTHRAVNMPPDLDLASGLRAQRMYGERARGQCDTERAPHSYERSDMAIDTLTSPNRAESERDRVVRVSQEVECANLTELAGLAELAELAAQSGLDVDRGIARINYDTELYAELLELFADIYRPFANTLMAAFESGDRDRVIHLLHTLKGSAGNIAADTLSQHSGRLVDRLRTEDATEALAIEESELSSLLGNLDRVMEGIENYLPQPSGVRAT